MSANVVPFVERIGDVNVRRDAQQRPYVPIGEIPYIDLWREVETLRNRGRAPFGVPVEQIARTLRHQSRIERAYAARLKGATAIQIENILLGNDLDRPDDEEAA